MLYPRNTEKKLDPKLFANPTSEYRGTPFWAWNGKLSKEELGRQIEVFKKMGLGGYHMHVRTGMDTTYMSDEYMDFIRFCTEKGKREEMLSWLYDEDRWPSGAAGGLVTGPHPEFAKKTLLFTHTPYENGVAVEVSGSEPGNGSRCKRMGNGVLLAVYDIVLDESGCLESAKRIGAEDGAEGAKWYAYMEHAANDPWFNDHPYVDTLNPDAIDEFIRVTHEEYKKAVGDEFGKAIPAIFTDEPQFTPKRALDFAKGLTDVFLPWTESVIEQYTALYGDDLLAHLPELVWENQNSVSSPARYRFHNLIADTFTSAFCERIGDWCSKNDILLTGHVMGEATLNSQTQAVGDAMRCYPSFGLPGIDMLCDLHEYNTAKQTQSIVRQQGAPGMLSELYGVTGWDYDFRGYKLQGDWQAALGVTVRVPHLAWMTMKGEAKRDYPASISYQSPWWEEFSMVENHFARLNTALTRGKASVRVGVVHPIESYWLHWGPSDQTAAIRKQMDTQFAALTETLLLGLIDFDFLCEATLPAQCTEGSCPMHVGEMAYDTIIVSGCETLRRTTFERLQAFARAGGKLIFIGECPVLVDALPCDDVQSLYDISIHMGFDATRILGVLEEQRDLDVRDTRGSRINSLIYQMRTDADGKWLFIANGVNPYNKDVEDAPEYRFTIKGSYKAFVYDTQTGAVSELPVTRKNGATFFIRTWYMHDSLLLWLEDCAEVATGSRTIIENEGAKPANRIARPVDITLDEPNMLLLDMARWTIDDQPMDETLPPEELLRLDNMARAMKGIPFRRKEITQPYCIAEEEIRHHLHLLFDIPCEYAVAAPMLALEDAQNTKVFLDGAEVPCDVLGYYVDRSIETIALPALSVGNHELRITVPFGSRTNLECFYVLGDFGVRVNGTEKTIISPARKLGFGDVVPQGLPFYTGNVNYHFDVETEGLLRIRIPQYRGGLVKVFVDGEEKDNIAYSPYTLDIGSLSAGTHRVTLKLFGVRQNGFAQLHHTKTSFYQSPDSWRSKGDKWTYEYQFTPMGILKTPEITIGKPGLSRAVAVQYDF